MPRASVMAGATVETEQLGWRLVARRGCDWAAARGSRRALPDRLARDTRRSTTRGRRDCDTRRMRRGVLLGAGLGLPNAGTVLLLPWLIDQPRDFGWYAYSPMPRRYADYLPNSGVHGWSAVAVVFAVLVVFNAAAVGAYVLVQKRGRGHAA